MSVSSGAAAPSYPSVASRSVIEFSMALGSFAIGICEFAPMGLMPEMADSLSVSELEVGHFISAYSLGVMVGAPILAVAGARMQRRYLLLLLMAFFAVGNAVSTLAADYGAMMLSRFLSGMPHGAYFGVMSLVAASLVPPDGRAKAVSRVMLGISCAMLFGSPLATWLGQLAGWRVIFAIIAGLALLTILMILLCLPETPHEQRNNPLDELKAVRNPAIWMSMIIGSVGFAGMFCAFSYQAPTLINQAKADPMWIPVALAAFGLGGISGNMFGGWLFDRLRFRSLGILLLWGTVTLLIYPLLTYTLPSMLLGCFLVGTMVSISPALQTHLIDIAADAQTLAAASSASVFNIANAMGPWLSGMAVAAGFGWSSTGFVGAAMTGLALLLYLTVGSIAAGQTAPCNANQTAAN
ncbi:MFS transporter [Oceanobacter mangrovi]|uniref:MFS transporter n=1 Tax=Oceanobacter mangrovi TaxID=2862510 RepID=UPI001C8DB75F|nr:MFS transporter [Oceanobacter mangrovi]